MDSLGYYIISNFMDYTCHSTVGTEKSRRLQWSGQVVRME